MWIVKLAAGLAVVCAALGVIIYLVQTRLIFPTGLAAGQTHALPQGAERFTIATPDGAKLAVLRIPASGGSDSGRPPVLGFGGNAWNADAVALLLHSLLPGHDVAAAYYRGYRPSTGRPSAKSLLADALLVHDRLDAPAGVIAVGFSIGTGIAAHLAAERPLAGLILVTPFDSLTKLARHHYPFVPAALLRHRIETVEYLGQVTAPTAIITAERDRVVPTRRSAPVAAATRNPVLTTTIAGGGHNDLYETREFAEAMRQAIARMPPIPR